MVKIVYEPEEKRAASYDDGKFMGECTYSDNGDFWVLDHTFVDDNYRGQKIAAKLVFELVEQARKNDKKIIPLCSFAKKEFANKEEYADVLKK